MWDTPFDESMIDGKNVIVRCNTKEDAEALFRIFRAHGITWCGGSLLEDTWFGRYCPICYHVTTWGLKRGSVETAENSAEWGSYIKCTFRTVTLADIDIPDDVDDLF